MKWRRRRLINNGREDKGGWMGCERNGYFKEG
jgi:hypothetical protein